MYLGISAQQKQICKIYINQHCISPTTNPQLQRFVVNDNTVWGRPVGVAVAKDGALLVSEDANGTIWRISR